MGFASWTFWRCPSGIANLLLDIYDAREFYDVQRTLLREGVARIAGSRDRLKRYFGAVERRFETDNGLTAAEFAGLARALGTVPEAAVILDGQLADRLQSEAQKDLERENFKPEDEAYKRRFKSALLMLAALLRHRKRRRDFLDPESRLGKQLLSLLELTEKRNRQLAKKNRTARGRCMPGWLAAARRMERNAEILADLTRFIRLQGRTPNLIEQIEAM